MLLEVMISTTGEVTVLRTGDECVESDLYRHPVHPRTLTGTRQIVQLAINHKANDL